MLPVHYVVALSTMVQVAAADGDSLASILSRIHEPIFPDFQIRVSSPEEHEKFVDASLRNDAPSLNDAIIAVNKAGGGIVELASNTVYYLKGPLRLLSNVQVIVGCGTTLKFSSNASHYTPGVLTKFEGTELFNYSPLVHAYAASNVSLIGKCAENSTLDGSGSSWFEKDSNDVDALREAGNDSTPLYQRVYDQKHLPPNFVEFFACENVLLENLTITNSPFWTTHLVASTNLIVRGNYIQTADTKNSDGCDPEGSTDVLIEHNTFNTGDDAIAIKAGRDADGWRIGRPSRGIVVRHNTLTTKCNALCIGSEISGGVQNVYFLDNHVLAAESLIDFKSNLDRGSFVRHVNVANITATNISDNCISFTNDYHGQRGGFFPTNFSGFNINNVTCNLSSSDARAISAVGIDGYPLHNVLITHLNVHTAATSGDGNDDDDFSPNDFVKVEFVSNFTVLHSAINDIPYESTWPASFSADDNKVMVVG